MRSVTIYETRDGKRFNSAEAAERHEKVYEEAQTATLPLGAKHPGGEGYIQHDLADVLKVKAALMKLARENGFGDFEIFSMDPAEVHPHSFAGRILSDGDNAIWWAWNRLCCTDEQGREWNQAYYALNPGKGTDRRIR